LNGLGLSARDADVQLANFEASFPVVHETPEVHAKWKAMVKELGVTGKQVEDARLVAVCHSQRISHLLTINGKQYLKFAQFGPGITIVDPTSV
jgi:hypothetical protein